MSWLKITIETTEDKVELLTDFLEQFDATSISYSPSFEEDFYSKLNETPLWQRTSVSALLDQDVDMDILLACLRNRIGTKNIISHSIALLEDENWLESYKQDHEQMVFANRLCVCPSWLSPDSKYPYTITLDPGLAFGTGTHNSTALCLEWLAGQTLEGKTVIDYGCGSGILALASASLGAEQVYAIDIDPQAIMATSDNTAKNKLSEKLIVTSPDLIEFPEMDILLANILLVPLLQLVEKFSVLVKPEGQIVLSGILAAQIEECLETYNSWFRMDEPKFSDEWAILTGYRYTS